MRRRTVHRVHAVVNRRLCIWGLDRRVWIAVASSGATTWLLTDAFVPAVLLYVVFYLAARMVTAGDPQWPQVVAHSRTLRRVYDVGQSQPVVLVRTPSCD